MDFTLPKTLEELRDRVRRFVIDEIIPCESDPCWTALGQRLGAHDGVSFMLADNVMDMHVARLSIWHCAWLLDRGNRASRESSMAKVVCSEAIMRVADRSMQILGGLGLTRDTVVERIFRDVRAFRIYDGPSEVHRWALGRRIVDGRKRKEGSGRG